MLKKLVGVAAAAVGLVVFVVPTAQAGSGRDRATGGGQILISSSGGAGDTIAFTAQNRDGATDDAATGQVQYVDRTGGTGQAQVVRHGVVSCLQVKGTVAKLAGTWKDGGTFQLLVQDNGEGAKAAQADQIAMSELADPTCEEEDDDDDSQTALARGNAQVHDAP